VAEGDHGIYVVARLAGIQLATSVKACVVGRRLRESGMAGLKTGHYKGAFRHVARGALRMLRKAPLERRSGHRRDALMCCCYWTIRVNLAVADALPEVAVTVTV
jgi:hypothetical protein